MKGLKEIYGAKQLLRYYQSKKKSPILNVSHLRLCFFFMWIWYRVSIWHYVYTCLFFLTYIINISQVSKWFFFNCSLVCFFINYNGRNEKLLSECPVTTFFLRHLKKIFIRNAAVTEILLCRSTLIFFCHNFSVILYTSHHTLEWFYAQYLCHKCRIIHTFMYMFIICSIFKPSPWTLLTLTKKRLWHVFIKTVCFCY